MTHSSRTAIVTGSSRGIGAAIAGRLAKDGFILVTGASTAFASDRSSS